MQSVAIGFWGAFFGCAALSLVGSLLAFTRSARRVALTGALAALLSAAYALVFLGWIPVENEDLLHRIQATSAIGSCAVLAVLLFLLLGTLRDADALARFRRIVGVLCVIALAIAWLIPARIALEFGVALCLGGAVSAVLASTASIRRGEGSGWYALGALGSVWIGLGCLDWYAFHPLNTPWQVHAASAVAGIAYLLFIAGAMWTRYAYLIEVSKVMTQGPHYDPVTSMPAYDAGDSMSAAAPPEGYPCGIIVVTISNLTMLEELHGRAAYNHALFVCASRLRRLALPGVEIARLREDGFLLVVRHPRDPLRLVDDARRVLLRLSRPVVLGTSRELTALESSRATWEANLGLGLLIEATDANLEISVAGARAMSRTALSFPSRMAWFDEAADSISEFPSAE